MGYLSLTYPYKKIVFFFWIENAFFFFFGIEHVYSMDTNFFSFGGVGVGEWIETKGLVLQKVGDLQISMNVKHELGTKALFVVVVYSFNISIQILTRNQICVYMFRNM